jgi:hypothetical protein
MRTLFAQTWVSFQSKTFQNQLQTPLKKPSKTKFQPVNEAWIHASPLLAWTVIHIFPPLSAFRLTVQDDQDALSIGSNQAMFDNSLGPVLVPKFPSQMGFEQHLYMLKSDFFVSLIFLHKCFLLFFHTNGTTTNNQPLPAVGKRLSRWFSNCWLPCPSSPLESCAFHFLHSTETHIRGMSEYPGSWDKFVMIMLLWLGS